MLLILLAVIKTFISTICSNKETLNFSEPGFNAAIIAYNSTASSDELL